jgi:hypothetical protein
VYPDTDEAETLYVPGFSVTVVPGDEPANDSGFGLFPETVIVKSDGFLLPPDTFVITLSVPNSPGGGIGKGVAISGGGFGKGPEPRIILWFKTGLFFFAA